MVAEMKREIIINSTQLKLSYRNIVIYQQKEIQKHSSGIFTFPRDMQPKVLASCCVFHCYKLHDHEACYTGSFPIYLATSLKLQQTANAE